MPERPRPVGGQQRTAHRQHRHQDPHPHGHRHECRRHDQRNGDDERQREPAGPAPARRGRAVPAHRAGHRVGVVDQLGQHRLRLVARARRQQQRRLPRACDAGHHRVQPRAAEQPHQQRLAQSAAAQPAHVEGVLALAQQAVLEMQHVRVAAQHQVPERHQRPQHRQHDGDKQHDHDDDGDTRDDTEPLRRVAARLGDPRMLQRRTETRLIHHADRGEDHRQTGEAQRAVAQPRRLPAGQQPALRLLLIAGFVGGSQRVGKQDRAQSRHLLGAHRVERELGVTAWPAARCSPAARSARAAWCSSRASV